MSGRRHFRFGKDRFGAHWWERNRISVGGGANIRVAGHAICSVDLVRHVRVLIDDRCWWRREASGRELVSLMLLFALAVSLVVWNISMIVLNISWTVLNVSWIKTASVRVLIRAQLHKLGAIGILLGTLPALASDKQEHSQGNGHESSNNTANDGPKGCSLFVVFAVADGRVIVAVANKVVPCPFPSGGVETVEVRFGAIRCRVDNNFRAKSSC